MLNFTLFPSRTPWSRLPGRDRGNQTEIVQGAIEMKDSGIILTIMLNILHVIGS
jgi:hypothetical protein